MRKENKILVPILVFFAFALGAAWSYLTIRQLEGKKIIPSQIVGNYTIDENSISGALNMKKMA